MARSAADIKDMLLRWTKSKTKNYKVRRKIKNNYAIFIFASIRM